MRRSKALVVHASLAALATLLCSSAASAQIPSEEGFDSTPEDTLEGVDQLEKEKADKMPGEQGPKKAEEKPTDPKEFDPYEDPQKPYRFIGMRWRNIIVPQFMLSIFADGGATVNVFAFGPEFTSRKDGVEWDVSLMYADYSMNPFMFKGKDDGNEAYEIVSSDMKVLYLTVDLLKEFPIDDKGRFSFLIGGGLGLGIVFGNLYRNQAYPDDPANPDPDNVGKWNRCVQRDTVPNPGTSAFYCDHDNDHYGAYDEASWINGGDKPSVFPWLSIPQVSFRVKPIRRLQARLDAGFSITGFFVGMSAGYGFPVD